MQVCTNYNVPSCVMSPWLLNIFMGGVIRDVNSSLLESEYDPVGMNIECFDVNQLLFVDDTTLVTGKTM